RPSGTFTARLTSLPQENAARRYVPTHTLLAGARLRAGANRGVFDRLAQPLANLDELRFVGEERIDDLGVEVLAAPLEDDVLRHFVAIGGLVNPGGRQGIVHVAQGDDSSAQRNGFSLQAVGIAGAVELLVV